MKNYKLKGTCIQAYNDKLRNTCVEVGEEVIEDRARYEELFAKKYLSVGEIVEEGKTEKSEKKKSKLEDFIEL